PLSAGASATPAGLTARARPEARPEGRAANLVKGGCREDREVRGGQSAGYRSGADVYVFDHERPVAFGRDHAVGVCALVGGCRVVVVSSGDDGIGFRLDRCARHPVSLESGRVRWGSELEQGHLDAVAGVVAVVGDVVAAGKMEAGGISPILVEIGATHRPVVHVG